MSLEGESFTLINRIVKLVLGDLALVAIDGLNTALLPLNEPHAVNVLIDRSEALRYILYALAYFTYTHILVQEAYK